MRDQSLIRSLLNCLLALPSMTPFQSVYSWNPHLQLDFVVQHRQKKFDLVHVEHLRGSKYARNIRAMFPNLPVVWDSVDCISHLFAQTSDHSRSFSGKIMSVLELDRTRGAEAELVNLFDHVLITSQIDKEALLQLAPPSNTVKPISVLPNGVDLEYFKRTTEKPRDTQTIVFSGKMSYHANVSMVDYLVREIMPTVWEKYPALKLIIVGKDPPRRIWELTRNPLVEVTGTVDDIRPYLWAATVAVVPLVYGAGIQNKILEAMACETPVVTTSQAFSSLFATPGVHALVGDSANDFSAAIISLIENPSLQRKLGLSGYAYVTAYHDWNKMASELFALYQHVISTEGQEQP